MSRLFFMGSCAAICALLLLAGPGAAGRVAPVSAADALQRVDSGVIRIEAWGCGRVVLSGSGFLVDDQHVATAEHVVAGAGRIVLRQGDRIVGSGTIAGADSAHDIALLRADRRIPGHVFSLSQRAPRAREGVAALGFPLGRPLTVARGMVHGTARMVAADGRAGEPLIQTDAAVHHGHSGGPLLSLSDGSVLGMVDLAAARGAPRSFAVSSFVAAPLLARWRRDPEAVPQQPCRSSGVSYPTLLQPPRLSGGASLPPGHM
jgi:putative serine protease PepD